MPTNQALQGNGVKNTGQKKGNLPELPGNEDEFWQGADKNKVKISREENTCEHFWSMISGREIQCINCKSGFITTLGTEVKNGHIYFHGEFVV